MSQPRVLVYVLRRDLRLADNPIFHAISQLKDQPDTPFTHVLPVYVFPASQIEISGLLAPETRSPYPEARSTVAGFWRCGQLRAKFLAESVWDLKGQLESAGSGLAIRAGEVVDVVQSVVEGLRYSGCEVGGVWLTGEEAVEEKREEKGIRKVCQNAGADCRIWTDEKYLLHE